MPAIHRGFELVFATGLAVYGRGRLFPIPWGYVTSCRTLKGPYNVSKTKRRCDAPQPFPGYLNGVSAI